MDRLSYANIVATIALFMSLGGVSYAAFSLPAGSVGARQLRRGAVTVGALGFPLGATSVSYTVPFALPKNVCNSPHRPGEVVTIVCPRPRFGGYVNPARLRVHVRRPGELLVSGLAEMGDQGMVETRADVIYAVLLDGHRLSVRELTLYGGQREQAPIQALVRISAGWHTIRLEVRALTQNSPDSLIEIPHPPRPVLRS